MTFAKCISTRSKEVDFAIPSHLAVGDIASETTAMTTLKEASDPKPLALMARTGAVVQLDWPTRQRRAVVSRPAAREDSALSMSQSIEGLNVGAHFLDRLSAQQITRVQTAGRIVPVLQGRRAFTPG